MAAHVRTTHIHAVIEAETAPEFVMIALKACISRAMNEAGIDHRARRRWARHGSTRYLWTHEAVSAAIRYVLLGQGTPMEAYEAPLR
jgi:hypothetical protein